MTDRIVGALILALSIWYGITAGSYEASFGDPLGPAAFPIMLSIPAAVLSLALILRPDAEPKWPSFWPMMRQAAAIALLLAYAGFLEVAGFPLATFLAVTLLGRLLQTTWPKAAISGAVMSAVLFITFDYVLDLPLPLFPEFMS